MNPWRLKPGYRENLTRRTWEGENTGVYWNPGRRALSAHYQYDVYLLAREIAITHGARSVLDVGSGPGMKAAALFCDVVPEVVLMDQPTTVDVVAQCCPAARFVPADLENPAIDLGRTFDLIVCADVIEHLIDPGPCLEFIRRHAAPHSWVVLSTPERDYRRGVHCMVCDKPEHVREWNGEEFVAMLADRGFQVRRHQLCPTLRPVEFRGDRARRMLEPFQTRRRGAQDGEADMMRSCQVCECQRSDPSASRS